MGVRILEDKEQGQACLYCSVSDFAFGPLFADYDEAQAFLDWLRSHDGRDPRLLADSEMERFHSEFLQEREVTEAE